MSYTIEDFLRCPESECRESDVGIDYYYDGENIFFSFSCVNCHSGSLEDDFRWYVKCPNCLDDPNGGVDRIEGEVNEDGVVKFECTECGCNAEGRVKTRWDSTDSDPKFEPRNY